MPRRSTRLRTGSAATASFSQWRLAPRADKKQFLPRAWAHTKGGFLPAFILKLFVTGSTPRANLAIANLRRICEQELHGDYELQIIDVLQHPQAAEDERILATPTLIKQLPPPLRRVIGDLSDSDKVLLGLEVRTRDSTPNPPTDS